MTVVKEERLPILSDTERREQFVERYKALCAETGFCLVSAFITIQSGEQQLVEPVIVPVADWSPWSPQETKAK